MNIIPSSAPLDLGLTAILALMYDKSSAVSKFLPIWSALAASTNPDEAVNFANHTLKFPIGVKETVPGISDKWAGLQLADIIAGAANRWAKWHVNQRFSNSNSGSMTQVIVKSKLEAIRRLREIGAEFFCIYRPE